MAVKLNKKRKLPKSNKDSGVPSKLRRKGENGGHKKLKNGIVDGEDVESRTDENLDDKDEENLDDKVDENMDEPANGDKDESEEEKEVTDPIEIFCIKTFREELSKPSAINALKRFINVKKTVIHEYLESGGNPSEILRAIQQSDKKNLSDVKTVFEALQIVLFQIITHVPRHIPNAIETCRYLMKTYMPTIHSMLSTNSSAKERKTVLRLLTSIVSLNSVLGRDILGHLSLHSQIVEMLAEQTNPTDKNSVRICFIHFLMSFLVEGDVLLIRQLLSKRGVLNSIFPGLLYDLPQTVNLILTTIKNHILENINIAKTVKVHTFNHYAVQHLVKLYGWKGPYNFKPKSAMRTFKHKKRSGEVEVDPVDNEVVQKSVHELLLVLCTSSRFGIVFQDKTFGTGHRCLNPIINTVLKNLEKPWDCPAQGELIVAILSACPDLFKNYVQQISPYIAPRNSEIWLKTISFVRNLISGIGADTFMKNCEHVNPKQLFMITSLLYAPSCILKFFDETFFQTIDMAVHHEVLKLLQVMLKQINNVTERLSSLQRTRKTYMEQFNKLLREHLGKHLPVIDNILTCLVLAFKIKKEEPKEDSKPDLVAPPVIQHVDIILDVLLLYNSCNLTVYENIYIRFDPTDILHKMDMLEDISDGDSNFEAAYLKTLDLLMRLNIKAFLPGTSLFNDIFPMLLRKLGAENEQINKQVKRILTNLIHCTGLYDANKTEIEIWLYSFKQLQTGARDAVADFMLRGIISSYKDTVKYFDRMSELRKLCLEEEANFNNILNAGYDELFNSIGDENSKVNLEVNMLGPVFICCLDLYQESEFKDNAAIRTYISLVSLYLFHNHHSYRIIANALKNLDLPIFEQYIHHWVSNEEPVPIKKVFKLKPLATIFSKALLSNESINVYDLLGLNIEETEKDNSFIVLDKIVTKEVQMESVEIYCLSNMCIFYLSRLAQMNRLTEEIEANIEKATLALYDVLLGLNGQDSVDVMTSQFTKSLLTNNVALDYFTPIPKKKKMNEVLMTQFVSNFLKHVKSKCVDFTIDTRNDQYLNLFRSKLTCLIKSATVKGTNLKNDDFISLMELLDLNHDDFIYVLSYILGMEHTQFVSIENDMSHWCKMLIFTLTMLSKSGEDSKKWDIISSELSCKLEKLYMDLIMKLDVEINFDLLEDCLYKFLTVFPRSLHKISSRLDDMLKRPRISKSTARLLSLCLERNYQKDVLMNFIRTPENISKKEIIFPLLTAALKHNFVDANLFQKVYEEYKTSIIKVLEKPHKAGLIYKDNYKIILRLISECMDLPTCATFTNKIHKFEVAEIFHMEMLDAIYTKVSLKKISTKDQKKDDSKYISNYYIVYIAFLNIILRKEFIDIEKIHLTLNLISNWSKRVDLKPEYRKNILQHGNWELFCKLSLKHGLKTSTSDSGDADYSNGLLLAGLSELCELMYEDGNEQASTVFQMAVSHSEFLNVMLNPVDNIIKTNLLRLLWCLSRKNPSVMQSSHVPVLLSAYHASLTLSDRLILALLQLYEKSGVSLYEYRPFLWGESAVNHYSVRSSVDNNLWRQPSMNEVLDLLEPEMVDATIRYFPVLRGLDAKDVYSYVDDWKYKKRSNGDQQALELWIDTAFIIDEPVHNDDRLSNMLKQADVVRPSDFDKERRVYDPAFLLPLFALLFAPEAAPAVGKAAVSGVVSVIWRAMGSLREDTRGAACLALCRLRGHMEAQRHSKDKEFWLHMIDSVRRGLAVEQTPEDESATNKNTTEAPPQIPSILSLFLSRASRELTQPLSDLYKPLSNYLIARESMEFKTIPAMLNLLHSPNPEYKAHRIWMLELMRDGMKTMLDFEVFLNSCAFKMIMDLYNSGVCDKDCKILILNIINNTVKVPSAVEKLVMWHGLIPWLQGVIMCINTNEHDLVVACVTIVNHLRFSLVARQVLRSMKKRKNNILRRRDCDLTEETMNSLSYLVVQLLPKLTNQLNSRCILKYLKICYHIASDRTLFVQKDIENLIETSEKIFHRDSGCGMLLETGGEFAEPLSALIEEIQNIQEDQIVNLGVKYLRLFVRKWIEHQKI